MSVLTVTQSMQQRKSVRAFSDRNVTREVLQDLLETAARAPSGSNLQPWKVYAVTGEAKKQLSQAIFTRAAEQPMGDTPDIRMYPEKMAEPWRQRRIDCGETMYTALGISRDNKAARFEQGAKNLTFSMPPLA